MPVTNKRLIGRPTGLSTSRTVTGAATFGQSDLNNVVVYDSASSATLTIPAGNSLGADVDDSLYIYVKGSGVPTIAWTGGTIRSPSGLQAPSQYGYIVLTWAPTNEWVQV